MSSINLLPLESIEGFIWLDGKFIKWNEAKIHVLTHSLHYSGSVFEGEKSYNGKIFKIHEHTERLFQSAKYMKLTIPYNINEIIAASYELLKKNNLQNAYIRPLAWRTTDALMVKPQNPVTHLMIAAWEPRKKTFTTPLNLMISNWRKPSDDAMPVQCKSSTQYGMLSIAVMEANEAGFDDAILLDKFGNIAECTTSNIFFVKNNNLFTPQTDFALNGFTRKAIIELSSKINIEVRVENITSDKLPSFEACFITGTALGLKEVGSITVNAQKHPYKKSQVFDNIQAAYDKLVSES